MNFCGWTVNPCDHQFGVVTLPDKKDYPTYPKKQQLGNINGYKRSIKSLNSQSNNKQNTYKFSFPNQQQQNEYQNYGIEGKNQVNNKYPPLYNQNTQKNANNSRQKMHDRIRQLSNSKNQVLKRSNGSIDKKNFNSFSQNYKNTTQTNQSYNSNIFSNNNNNTQKSLNQLLIENAKLKKIIEQQYKPLILKYEKLKEQNFQRDYQVSQLQWKVKQLAKQVKSKK